VAVCRRRQRWGRRRRKQADCSLGDSGGDLRRWRQRRAAICGGNLRRWRRRRAAEGGGGSSVDVLDVRNMRGSDSPSFLYKPTVGIVQRPKSRFLPSSAEG
jgi:hypothetical protein